MRDYPQRLYHLTPGWVRTGALFHVRIRAAATQSPVLTDPALAAALLSAAQRYHDVGRWWCELFLLMPDHLHAMLAFPREPGMAAVIRDWKRGTARFQDVQWQENFFDHRIRSSHEKETTWTYLHGNPAAKGLCREDELWPCWWSALTSTR
jgi:REP element-mobilizing transposase RayT